MKHNVMLPDGVKVPAIGEGTWYLGESMLRAAREEESLIKGAEAGMTLIDTAELYGNGAAEELTGRALKKIGREKIFLVSKVLPRNAGRGDIFRHCDKSLSRLGTDYLDLYLLHWRGSVPIAETVECMEELKKAGKIVRWGVSNFDTDNMKDLWKIQEGNNCVVNQVCYHIASRGIEFSLLPWMRAHNVPLMAYCPLAQAGRLRDGLYANKTLNEIAKRHGVTVPQVMLAFVIRDGSTIAIPRTGRAAHALENAAADNIELTQEDLVEIDREFPAPTHETYLDIV